MLKRRQAQPTGARLDAKQEIGSSHVGVAFGFRVAGHRGRLTADVVIDDALGVVGGVGGGGHDRGQLVEVGQAETVRIPSAATMRPRRPTAHCAGWESASP